MLFVSVWKLCNNWSVNSRSLLAAASLDMPGKNRCHQSKCSKCGAQLMIISAWCSRWLLRLPSSCRQLRGSCISQLRSVVSCQDHSLHTHFTLVTAIVQEYHCIPLTNGKKGKEKRSKMNQKGGTQTCHRGIGELARSRWTGWRDWILEMRLHRPPPYAWVTKKE